MNIGNLLIGTALGCIVLASVMTIVAYQRRPKSKRILLSEKDAEVYAGKYVMINGFHGPVVASGDTIEAMFAEAALLDEDVQRHLVQVYVPRKDEVFIGGRVM